MERGERHPEVIFSLEARKATPAQTEAGKRLFGKLATRASASVAARSSPNEGQEHLDDQGVGGEQRWP